MLCKLVIQTDELTQALGQHLLYLHNLPQLQTMVNHSNRSQHSSFMPQVVRSNTSYAWMNSTVKQVHLVANVSLHFLYCLTTGDALSAGLINMKDHGSDSTEVCYWNCDDFLMSPCKLMLSYGCIQQWPGTPKHTIPAQCCTCSREAFSSIDTRIQEPLLDTYCDKVMGRKLH
jgi:hypothetical protein